MDDQYWFIYLLTVFLGQESQKWNSFSRTVQSLPFEGIGSLGRLMLCAVSYPISFGALIVCKAKIDFLNTILIH